MSKSKYARFKFMVRRGNLVCIGQKRTMRGTNYDADRVYVPLEKRSAKAMKEAMALGIASLEDSS